MIHADMFLRGAAIALGLLCAVALMARPEMRRVGWPVTALMLTKAGYLIGSAPGIADLPDGWRPLLTGGAILLPLAFSWLVVEIFLDAPQDRWPWLGVAGAGVALSLASLVWPPLDLARGLLLLGLYVSLLWLGLTTARNDLVEHRRRFRPGFLAAMALLGVAVTSVELVKAQIDLPLFIYPLQAAAFLILSFAFALWVLNPSADLCCETAPRPMPETRRKAAIDAAVIDDLNAAMAGGVWKREGLTIAALGAEIGVPEHRLRAVINQRLGFRNFPTFINSYRIKSAQAALADPAQARRTILEIAYASGFASLGPFNKAFRDRTGESPSEYRARLLDSAQSAPVPENHIAISKSERPRPV